jgi:hypothetical protein
MVNVWFGAAWILMGLIWLRKAYTGKKSRAIITLSNPEDLVIDKRERTFALVIGIANVALGIANVWVGLRPKR